MTGVTDRLSCNLTLRALAALVASLAISGTSLAASAKLDIPIAYVTENIEEPPPLSLVEVVAKDKGLAGAKLAIGENNTTGRFLNQNFALVERSISEDETLEEVAAELAAAGLKLIVADLEMSRLLQLSGTAALQDAVIFNIRAKDDALRTETCKANIFHITPNYAMEADALGQFLSSQRWRKWVLISGVNPSDQAFAQAVRRAAKRYRMEIVEEREYEFKAGSRRTDTGEQQIREQMTKLTQRLPEHDVVIVADKSEVFGEYLPYRTWNPRPVAGTQGLMPTAWHRSHEQWGATQLQRRFTREFNRWMLERDYAGWAAVRAIGEAVTRASTADPVKLRSYLLSGAFGLAAFKGQALTFRPWDQQLRQPILLVSPLMLISVSPQQGFLHERTPLDTLGMDKPDSRCRLNE